ncbi:ATP-binding protein [Rapidithrix thailandica]|uniref:histidine kinase n=1 Tax=Rapidithrix thailandica TaxID=413964 RepID=A0AAW9RUV3_9BACT
MAKTNNQVPDIKAKVRLGFGLALLIIVVAGYITISNFQKLSSSVELLSHPDQKLFMFNRVLTDISEAEGSARAFTLTSNQENLDMYYKYMDKISKTLDSLKSFTLDVDSQRVRLDSISTLMAEKKEGFATYIEWKSWQQSQMFTDKAIKEIDQNTSDTVSAIITTQTKTTTDVKVDTLVVENEEEKKKKGFLGLGGLFSSKKNKKAKEAKEEKTESEESKESDKAKNVENEVATKVTETKVKYDTSVVVKSNQGKLIRDVKSILEEIKMEERYQNWYMNEQELKLLQKDQQIMEQIKSIITEMEQEQFLRSQEKTKAAKNIANSSILVMLVVGLAGLVISIVFIYLISRDIAKSNFYRRQLIKAKSEAERLARVKEEFLANMSHEIRTPLNAILGFSEQLAQTRLVGKQEQWLSAVKDSSIHLLDTVNDILDFSKLEAGKLRFEQKPFKLEYVLSEVYRICKVQADKKNLALSYILDDKVQAYILEGDEFRLRQVLYNLLSNAIKFTVKGSVQIFASGEDNQDGTLQVSIMVKDSGIGIPKDKLEVIFESFSQSDTTITRKYGGTGLGLTISRKILEEQGGSIQVASEPGKGTEFSFNLAYKISELKEIVKQSSSINYEEFINRGLRILVMDDDDFNIMLTQAILKKCGVQLFIAKNGKEGLRLVHLHPFDIILSDIQMPEMSGVEFIEALRAMPDKEKSELPVVALTANAKQTDLDHYLEKGMTDYLLKPFKEESLLNKIANVLGMESVKVQDEGRNYAYSESEEEEELEEIDWKGPEEVVIDLSELEVYAGGDKTALAAILTTLKESSEEGVKRMSEAMAQNNMEQIRELAHRLHPALEHLRVDALAVPVKYLESWVKENQHLERVPELVTLISERAKTLFVLIDEKAKELETLEGA